MQFDFVTLFPEAVEAGFSYSILRRAREAGLISVRACTPRDFATDAHKTVDDTPYGGGPGMLMMPEPLDAALRSLQLPAGARVVFPDPTGVPFRQGVAASLAESRHVVFVCGHYEGIDARVLDKWATDIVSLGDYVLTGGELPALVMADAVARLIPGVLGSAQSLEVDSHSDGLLSAPQYTRPAVWEGREAPDVLQGGDHKAAARWKRAQSLRLTLQNRPELLARANLTREDAQLLSDPDV